MHPSQLSLTAFDFNRLIRSVPLYLALAPSHQSYCLDRSRTVSKLQNRDLSVFVCLARHLN